MSDDGELQYIPVWLILTGCLLLLAPLIYYVYDAYCKPEDIKKGKYIKKRHRVSNIYCTSLKYTDPAGYFCEIRFWKINFIVNWSATQYTACLASGPKLIFNQHSHDVMNTDFIIHIFYSQLWRMDVRLWWFCIFWLDSWLQCWDSSGYSDTPATTLLHIG